MHKSSTKKENLNLNIAIVCLYTALPSWHGAAYISSLMLKYFPTKNKHLFQFVDSKRFKKHKNVTNINIILNSPLFKLFFLILLILKIKKYFYKKKNKILVIEGASWSFFSYLVIKLAKYLIKDLKIIYHSHNVEYEVRKLKNSKIILFLTKIFEREILKLSDYNTAVSQSDKKLFFDLYNIKTIILKNGVDNIELKTNFTSKLKLPKKFIFFPGSYSYYPNKEAIDEIVTYHMEKILKKYKEFYFIFSGEGLPKDYLKYKKIKYYGILTQKDYNYVLSKSSFIFLPLKKAPGTKLKTLQAIALNKIILCTSHALKGIETSKLKNIFKYKNKKEVLKKITYIVENFKNVKIKQKDNKKYFKENLYFKNLLNEFAYKYLNDKN